MNIIKLEEKSELQFDDMTHLEQKFIQGGLQAFPSQITLNNIVFNFSHHRDDISWSNIITDRNAKALTSYTISRKPDNIEKFKQMKSVSDQNRHSSINEVLAFGWIMDKTMKVVPVGIGFTTVSRLHVSGMAHESLISTDTIVDINETTSLSYEESVLIQGINNNKPIMAKIDTGADVCSLHATDIKINNETVAFSLNNQQYNVPLHRVQNIRQADSDSEPRPVVLLSMTVAGQTISNVECNLNDRSGMSNPLLIGRNLLSQHDFTIQTLSNEAELTDWVTLDKLFENIQIPTNIEPENVQEKLVELMATSDISLQDLTHAIYESKLLKNNNITY